MSVSHRLWANGSIRFGAVVLGFMVLVSLLAPWLGTVDPSAMDSNFINKPAGLKGDFTLLDGSTVAHTFWLGTDSFGRDLFSRVVYGAQVSLLVGGFTAVLALAISRARHLLVQAVSESAAAQDLSRFFDPGVAARIRGALRPDMETAA